MKQYVNIDMFFGMIFFSQALRFIRDLEFFIYNYFKIPLNFLFIIIGVSLAGLLVIVSYRVYRKSINRFSFFFVIGSLLLTCYYLFIDRVVIAFLLDIGGGDFFIPYSIKELNILYYVHSGLILITYLIAIVSIIKGYRIKIKSSKTLNNNNNN